jgi:hypothetical protein
LANQQWHRFNRKVLSVNKRLRLLILALLRSQLRIGRLGDSSSQTILLYPLVS